MLPGAHIIISNGISLNLTTNPISGFILGVIMHHLTDSLPHIDLNILKNYNEFTIKNLPKNLKILLTFEFLTGFLFSFLYFVYLFNKNLILFLFISLGAIFPDLIMIFFKRAFEKYGFGRRYINFHKNFHYELKNNSIKNVIFSGIIEILIIFLSIIFFNLSSKFV